MQPLPIGFVSAPAWLDPSPAEFPLLCADPVVTQQNFVRAPHFDYALGSVPGLLGKAAAAAGELAAVGCQAAAMAWSPLAWASREGGNVTPETALERQAQISALAGLPVSLIGPAVLGCLEALGARKVGLACTYYTAEYRAGWNGFVGAAGYQTVALSLADIGHWPEGRGGTERWEITPERISANVEAVLDAMPDADAVVLSGGAARSVSLLGTLASRYARPVFGVDAALYWALARSAKISLKPDILGPLSEV